MTETHPIEETPIPTGETPPPAAREPMIKISPTHAAPLSAVLALVDKDCKICNGTAWTSFVNGGGEAKKAICWCCIRRFRRALDIKRKAELEAKLSEVPVSTDQRDQEKAARRIQALERQLGELVAELDGKRAKLDERLTSLQAEQGLAKAEMVQAHAEWRSADTQAVEAEEEIIEAERAMAELRLKLHRIRARKSELMEAEHAAGNRLAPIETQIGEARAAFEASTIVPIGREIAKLQRRISTCRGYNPGVG